MNPFTESTVARPANESWSSPSDEPELAEAKRSGGASSPTQVRATARFLRRPRPERLVRRRSRGQVVRRAKQTWTAKTRTFISLISGVVLACTLSSAWAVNVNSATAQQLETITGIGPKTAQVIIDERTRGGSFESFDDLAERVKGIGPKKARSLQAAGLSVGQAASDSKPAVPTGRRAPR